VAGAGAEPDANAGVPPPTDGPAAPGTREPPAPLSAALRDGTPLRLRPIRPDDKALLTEGIEHLSVRSRYRRFFVPIRRLSERQLHEFTEVDYVDHFAWVASVVGQEPAAIGVARYVRDADDPLTAEVAVTVLDEWQGRGAGTVLLAATALVARDHGTRRLRAEVLAENHPMIAVLLRLGGEVRERRQDMLTVDLDIEANLARLRQAIAASAVVPPASGTPAP
jgi:RimJ/RimL family protein N-acetyltransferase